MPPTPWVAVEDRLAAEGREAVPLLRAMGAEDPSALRRGLLASAAVRAEWGWDPRTKITAWAARLGTDDAPFTFLDPPRHLGDPALARLFPTLACYTAAAPEAPFPLRAANVFFVGADGALLHLASAAELETFLRTKAPAVTEDDEATVHDLLAAWLALSQALAPAGDAVFVIPPDGLTATYRTSVASSMSGWRGQARAVPPEGSRWLGEITVQMTFDTTGKLKTIAEVRTLAQEELRGHDIPDKEVVMEQ